LKFPTIWRDFQEHRNKTATYGVGRKKVSGYRFLSVISSGLVFSTSRSNSVASRSAT
jgi:hypothetical protein